MQLMPYLDKSRGEFGLHVDLDVLLWQESRQYNLLSPLKFLDQFDFVVVTESEMKEFEEFKQATVPLGSSIFKVNNLLEMWLLNHKQLQQFDLFGKSHVCLQQEQVDELIEWIMELRGLVDKRGRAALALQLDGQVRLD